MRTLGDSMLAYFGYPKVHEHDAPRAVRAALELTRAVHKIDAAQIGNFRTRIGVATGLMLVGELGSMGSRDAGGMGEALNLALHMQKAAPADGVVIAAGTRTSSVASSNTVKSRQSRWKRDPHRSRRGML